MYLPDSRRVFDGFLRFDNTNDFLAQWRPADFAGHLGEVCTNLDVRLIDAFPALRRNVEKGGVPYNLVGDTHLSVEGSQVVADVLADALRPGVAR